MYLGMEQQDPKVDGAATEQLERGYTMGTLPWQMVYVRATKTRPAKLIWNFAHSSLDGWSLSILNDTLTNLLNGKDIESSSYRAYADFIAARDTRENVRWFRQNLLPLSSPCWPIAEPSKLKSEPVCETLFYTEWNLDFNRLSKALGVTPFAAALAAVVLTIGQRERSLDTDGGTRRSLRPSPRVVIRPGERAAGERELRQVHQGVGFEDGEAGEGVWEQPCEPYF